MMHFSPAGATISQETTGPRLQIRLIDEISTVRAELTRCDTKAIALLTLAAQLLLPGVAVLAAGRVHGLAAALGWTAAALLLAAIILCGAVKFPRLGGAGFTGWARADAAALLAELAEDICYGNTNRAAAEQLHRLSMIASGKYRTIQAAMIMLVAALVAAAATALTVWAR
jgi:Family of unknown function (DUF5706)